MIPTKLKIIQVFIIVLSVMHLFAMRAFSQAKENKFTEGSTYRIDADRAQINSETTKTIADNTTADVIEIDQVGKGQNNHKSIFANIKAYVSFNGQSTAYQEVRFTIQNNGAARLNVSTKSIVSEQIDSRASNFDITTFDVSATTSDISVIISLTSDFSTSVLTTMSEVEVVIESEGFCRIQKL